MRAFAEIAAEAREEGFLVADRAGIVTAAFRPRRGAARRGRRTSSSASRSRSSSAKRRHGAAARVPRKAGALRRDGAARACVATSEDGEAEIALFAEGQAGIVTGYFGFVAKRDRRAAAALAGDDDIEPAMLARLSRGIRRPLNTIIGFADLIRSAAFGAIDAASATSNMPATSAPPASRSRCWSTSSTISPGCARPLRAAAVRCRSRRAARNLHGAGAGRRPAPRACWCAAPSPSGCRASAPIAPRSARRCSICWPAPSTRRRSAAR